MALLHYTDYVKTPFMFCNAYMYLWECDYWTLDLHGVAREYEIKVSLADFKRDALKDKHRQADKGAHYFYYVCPEGVIPKELVDTKYGLIYVKSSGSWHGCDLRMIRRPRRLHNKPFSRWQQVAEKAFHRWRPLWFEKLQEKEITFEEYKQGFDLSDIENQTHEYREEVPKIDVQVFPTERGDERDRAA